MTLVRRKSRKYIKLFVVTRDISNACWHMSSMHAMSKDAHPHASRRWFLSNRQEALEEQLDAKIGHGRSEEHWALLAGENAIHIKWLHKPETMDKYVRVQSQKSTKVNTHETLAERI